MTNKKGHGNGNGKGKNKQQQKPMPSFFAPLRMTAVLF
jgi:hypothetical protein